MLHAGTNRRFLDILFWSLDASDVSGAYYDDVAHQHHLNRVATPNQVPNHIGYSSWQELGKALRQFPLSWPFHKGSCQSLCRTPEDDDVKDHILVNSQVIFRHGARTPLWPIPGIPEAKYDKETLLSELAHTEFGYDVIDMDGCEADDFDNSPVNKRYTKVLEGGMLRGQLTAVGAHQCYELGLQLRRRYIQKHKLISDEFNDNEIYMRSTYIQRTLESLKGVIAGLYGVDKLREQRPVFNVAYYNQECIYPNVNICKCLKEIGTHGTGHLGEEDPGRKALSEKIEQAIGYTKDRPLDFVGLRDDLVARDAHGLALPPQLEPFYDAIHRQASIDFLQMLAGRKEDRAAGLMLSVGPFYHLILDKMDKAVEGMAAGASKHKLAMYSSHDSMLMPLLVSLGCYNWNWPPYTSYIAYELWKHKHSCGHFVKIIYNGKELTIADKTKTLIPLQEFKDFLSPFKVLPENYKDLCENTRHSIEQPSVGHALHHEDSKSGTAQEEDDAPAGM